MHEEIVFAGFGGQGIMFMGKAMAYAAMKRGKLVTWMPSYGAEVRGGTAHSMVVISDKVIASPIVKEPSVCVVMNKPSFDRFNSKVTKDGILIVNKSMIKIDEKRKDIGILEVPATEMAYELGDSRVANMITLGALLSKRDIFPVQSLIDILGEVIPKSRQKMLSINQDAVRKGYEYGSR